VFPTWNEERYLPRCLGSLRNQLDGRQEIIVVDCGSDDRTIAIARELADRVLLEPGKPVGAARNAGAKVARGEILAFLDADTVASGRWLKEITGSLNAKPSAVGVTGPTAPYEGSRLDDLLYRVATGWAQRCSLKLGFPHVAGFNCAYKREPFWEAGGFDERRELSEDVLLSLRMRHQGQILFNQEMVAYTSLRRINDYGYLYLTTYYAMNTFLMLLFRRNLSYPKVR
jgi:glycosyltransferase involved in cell wall biosynthesis